MATNLPLSGLIDPFDYTIHMQGAAFRPREVSGSEGLSRTFRFELTFHSADGFLSPADVSGNTAELRIDRGGLPVRRFFGIVTEARLTATATGAPHFRGVFEPRLALLRHRSNCRVFRDKTVPEIVTEVLGEIQVGTELRLRSSYVRRPYTVQYNETDYDFVARLLEDEGIFYAFPNYVDPPEATVQLNGVILGDSPGAYQAIEGDPRLPFRRSSGLGRTDESITSFKQRASMGPGKVSVRDWNLERPSANMDGSADGPTKGSVELYRYPGKFELPAEAARKAQLMADALACKASVFSGASDTTRLVPAQTFALEAEGDAQSRLDGEYVVVALQHSYRRTTNEGGGAKLDVAFDSLPSTTVFRPERVTPRPFIANPHTGIVTGPAGADIHTDAYGRVKVHMMWDRVQPHDDSCSHWIPVLQDNTGSSAAIPRVGWEVMLSFVDGDPDRPFVLGRVYNGQDVFPEPLPANKTKSALRSLSSPGRGGQNEIWLEDKAGAELMSMQAQKDQNVSIENDKTEKVKNVEVNKIVGNEDIIIGRNNTVTVKGKQNLGVDGDQSIRVAAHRKRTVGAAESVTVKGARSTKIGSMHFRKIGGFDNVGMKKSIGERIGGVDVEASLKKNSTDAGMAQTLTVGGAVVEVAGQGKSETTEMLRVETIGMSVITDTLKTIGLEVKKKRSTKIGMELLAQAGETMLLKADKAWSAVAKKATVESEKTLTIECGGSSVVFNSDGITMKSDMDIVIKADNAAEIGGKITILP